MARAGVRFSVSQIPPNAVSLIAGRLSTQAGAIRSLKDPLEQAVDEVIRPRIRENFASESAAGVGWVGLSETTTKDRMRKGFGEGPILRRTGHLSQVAQQKNIWTFRPQEGEAFVSSGAFASKAFYGIYHDLGIGRNPQREIFVIGDSDVEAIGNIFVEWLDERLSLV